MIIKTMDQQDKYDLLVFYRDNLISSSGTVGDWVDLAYVPQVLGVDLPERLQKWLAYKKQGMGLIDSSQEGAQTMNTIFNGYDDTVKAQSIQAINLAIQSIQQQVSMVTGVLPEALAQYEQRDAVSNVKLGVQTTMLLTKQIFNAMDTVYQEANYDMLNLAKLVWPKGITGTIVLGNYSKIFTALPQYYTLTDFDIHIEDSTKSYQNVQSLIAISGELVKSGVADLGDITNIITASSITELKRYIDRSIARKKRKMILLNSYNNKFNSMNKTLKNFKKLINNYKNKFNSYRVNYKLIIKLNLKSKQKRLQLRKKGWGMIRNIMIRV